MDKLRQYLELQMVGVKNHDLVIIHVGTNNVERNSVGEICRQFGRLIQAIHHFNPTAKVAVSSILPRPKDWDVYGQKVMDINKALVRLQRNLDFTFLKTYRPFWNNYTHMPRSNHFARDGLHLSALGVAMLKNSLEGAAKRLAGR